MAYDFKVTGMNEIKIGASGLFLDSVFKNIPDSNNIGVINPIGTTALSLGTEKGRKILQPGGILEYTPGTIITIKCDDHTFILKNVKGSPFFTDIKGDFILYDASNDSGFVVLSEKRVIVVGKKSEDARRLHRSLGDDFPDFGYSIMMSKSGSSSRFTVLSLQSPIKVRVELQSMTTADRDEILKQSLIKLQELKGKFNHKNPFFIWLSSKCDVYGIEDKLEDNDSGYGLFIQVSLNDQGYLEYKGVAPDRNKVFLDDKGKKDTTGLFFEGAARLLISKYNAAVSDSKGSGPRSNIAPGQKIVITRKDPKSLQN